MIASPHVLALYILKSAAVAGHAASREHAMADFKARWSSKA